MKEVADSGVVAIAMHYLAPEVIAVVFEFFLDIRELRVELILLRRRSGA